MELDNLSVLPLHNHPEHLRQCCEMINDEWPRSETARMMSLQASRDALPTSFILVNNDRKCVIGHCKLTPIPSIPESCFIETVVISKSLRGKKLGSYLMRKTEEYCKEILKKRMIHLSTKGQENFYAKLGYIICEPVTIYGCHTPNRYILDPVSPKTEKIVPPQTTPGPGAPPPPPPMPTMSDINGNNNNNVKTNKTYMFKYLE